MSERLTAMALFDVWTMTVDFVESARARIGLGPSVARTCLIAKAKDRHGEAGAAKAGEMFDVMLRGTANLSTGKTV